MRFPLLQRALLVSAITSALSGVAFAQEATITGTVIDSTGGALPGVTVRAVHEASGNSFEAVTDGRGEYRLPVRVGAYRLTADLAGFSPVARTLTLLVGQEAVVSLQMAVSSVQESVTVTADAPLLDVTQSSLGGNVDPRQLQELPVQGRDWLDLVLLTPGIRINAVQEAPSDVGQTGSTSSSRNGGDYQINLDGQAITQLTTGAIGGNKGQPKFSRDAIAEFQTLTSRFDATQGRSTGLQVNAVTKSGTNTPSGSLSGYFRHDRFIAADHVAKRVLPYQDQQLSGTFGGPIRRDKVHLFANYEYEHEPLTLLYTTPYPHFNRDLHRVHAEHKAGLRLDGQFTPGNRLSVRGNRWKYENPSGGGGTSTPQRATDSIQGSDQVFATLTQVLGTRAVNEIKAGYAGWLGDVAFLTTNPRGTFPQSAPMVELSGLSAGAFRIFPNRQGQDVYSIRDDFTYSFTKGGRHTLKVGAEYLYQNFFDYRCDRCDGELTATGGPIPANIESLFPDLFDASTWNLAPLSPISVRWRQAFQDTYRLYNPRYSTGVWLQDDWSVTQRLTLNLGVRYDVELNAFANDAPLGPFVSHIPNDTNNVGPRVGFTFSANDRTVIRGGGGVYFGTVSDGIRKKNKDPEYSLLVEVRNDGRPDFASNPFNGRPPTYAELVSKLCTPALEPGCTRPEATWAGAVYGPNFTMPYSYQSSIGLQRQLATTMAVEVDYVFTGTRNDELDFPVNVTYNPATGANYPFSDISRRPFPHWGYVSLTLNGRRMNYHALQTAFTKRFSDRWQASGTYTLSVFKDGLSRPVQWTGSAFEPVPFEVAPDLGGEYSYALGDQRHRAVFNGIWELGYSFQLSGLYFFGSGARFDTNWGTDLRQLGGIQPNSLRLRPDGTIVPRNDFVGKPIHRVDLRLQRGLRFGGRPRLDGILELFNALNHANYGSYITQEVSRNYGQPNQVNNVAYGPRTLQLGFRFAF
jgi:hypothetical protein